MRTRAVVLISVFAGIVGIVSFPERAFARTLKFTCECQGSVVGVINVDLSREKDRRSFSKFLDYCRELTDCHIRVATANGPPDDLPHVELPAAFDLRVSCCGRWVGELCAEPVLCPPTQTVFSLPQELDEFYSAIELCEITCGGEARVERIR